MQRLIIKLDENKIDELGIDRAELQETLDDAFERNEYIKTVLEDGTMQFDLKPGIENYVCAYGCVYATLAYDEDFLAVCKKWIWYSDEGESSDDYEETDVLALARE